MNGFDEQMTQHLVDWRKQNIASEECGWYNRKQYQWILDSRNWEENLWPGIRTDSHYSLPGYLYQNRIQKHRGSNNLKSSWILCANLYFPFGTSDQGRELLAGFLREKVHPAIRSVDGLELEYAESGALHPSILLGERGGRRGAGQTSPDIGFLVNGGLGLILTENKFVEHSFYRCSARVRNGSSERAGNPDPSRCDDALAILDDPAGQCHQVAWGRKYWEHIAPILRREMLSSLSSCPAAYAGYQLFRQQALAEGIATSGQYDVVASCLAIDERNDVLRQCLKTTGIADIRQWGRLFNGKAHFAVFSHQQWVAWVRTHGSHDQWVDWLNYVETRYGFAP
jgi:hypothetical protein